MSQLRSRTGSPVAVAVTIALGLATPAVVMAEGPSKVIPASVESVEFIGMPAPATNAERATAYSTAKVKVTYRNGDTRLYPLSFRELHDTTSTFDGVTVGDLYDQYGNILRDPAGQPQRSETTATACSP